MHFVFLYCSYCGAAPIVYFAYSLSSVDSVMYKLYYTWLHTIMIQGGKVVTLFNVKQEAYLSGYGSFANDCLPDFLKSCNAGHSEKYASITVTAPYMILHWIIVVGYRERKLIKGIRKTPPQSGDTFLQLEIANNPTSGNKSNMCILHICSIFTFFAYW